MSSTQQIVLIVVGALAGLAVGSFTCVIIDRLPLALDEPNEFGDLYDSRPWREVFGGHSRCSGCGTPIHAYDNIPVLSWLILRGRCRTCGDRIPAYHPLVELAIPAIGLAMVWSLGWGWRIAPVLWLVPVGVAVSVIDFRTFIVPTRLVWPGFAVSVVLSVAAALIAHEPRWLWGGVIGLAFLAGPLFVIWFILPSGMGFGDVRLATLLGWTVGFAAIDGAWPTAATVALATLGVSAAIGILFSVVGLTARGRKAKVPFGPALFLGSMICMIVVQATH